MSCFGFGKQEFCQLLLPELMKTKVAWTHANDGSHASFVLVSLNATAQWNENKNFTRTEYSNDRKFTCIEFSIYLLDYIHTRADEFGTLPKFLRFHFIRTGIPTVRCDRIRATCECERRNLVNLSGVSKSRNLESASWHYIFLNSSSLTEWEQTLQEYIFNFVQDQLTNMLYFNLQKNFWRS